MSTPPSLLHIIGGWRALTERWIEFSTLTSASAEYPCAMVVYGAGGDMTKRLQTPALYNLSRTNLLPEKPST